MSHYRIVGALGRGAMGVVYRAEDTNLQRAVALKFLPPGLTAEASARQRLLAEARAAATLDHPNICTVYEIGETPEGELFLAMAYYEGETLRERLARGPLAPAEAVDLAIQIGQGLAHAHEASIVHRDVKPGNIIVTRGGVAKIVDFGLARAIGEAAITQTGSASGTPAYMSPEQLRGATDLDARTDAWSLGVVLYEMLAGRRPFAQDNVHALGHSILSDDPPPLADSGTSDGGRFTRLVAALLVKERDRRMTLRQFLLEARRPSIRTSEVVQKKSLVVLPFEDISPAHDNEYFADGLTEEIIADLSRIGALRVISRTSAMRLKGAGKDVRSIGRELDVHYVLEGSVRKAGNQVRIAAQLIDATNDAHLWADKYTGTLDDVFEIQERVSRSIAAELRVKLSAEESHAIAQRQFGDSRAYECYLRARHTIWQFTPEALTRALDELAAAEALIGENVLILATRGFAYWQMINLGVAGAATIDEIETIAQRILALEPGSAHGERLIGLAAVSRGRGPEARRYLLRAAARDAADPETLVCLTVMAALTGQTAEGRDAGRRLLDIDPLIAFNHVAVALVLFFDGDPLGALEHARRGIALDPLNPVVLVFTATVLAGAGRREEAIALIDRVPASESADSPLGALMRFGRHALAGDRTAAMSALTPEVEAIGRLDLQNALWMADFFAMLGDVDRSLAHIDLAVGMGLGCYRYLATIDPFLEPVRRDPRWQPILERARRCWELSNTAVVLS